MKHTAKFSKYIYWVPNNEFSEFKSSLIARGIIPKAVYATPCETLRAKADVVRYASSETFNGLCQRQGSWYRNSNRAGSYLVVSAKQLPKEYSPYFDATIIESDFQPDLLPNQSQLKDLVASNAYKNACPNGWENKGIKDSLMFKVLFSITGFWGWGDNLSRHWLSHRANHANFLAQHHTVEMDGEQVPYSVTQNDGVCSSCVEFFNITASSSRKMVRACPGAVSFASVKRKKYYDVTPVMRAAE